MTNRQWLLEKMQNMSDEDFVEAFESGTYLCELQGCGVKRNTNCEDCVEHWLTLEHKEPIKLSEAERVILENIDEDCKWIARDLNGDLYLYENKPFKTASDNWRNTQCEYRFTAFNHLFQFVKWEDREPYNIEELLKCE